MENNPIVGKDMAQHALQCFERGAATWWRMYQTINGWQGVTTWKEFKLTLPKSQFVSQELKPHKNDVKKHCACKLCGEIGHNHKEHKDECPNCEGSHPVEESLRESWIRGCPDGRTIPSAGLLDYEDTRLKTPSRVRKGLSLAWKASLAIRICRSPTIVTDFV